MLTYRSLVSKTYAVALFNRYYVDEALILEGLLEGNWICDVELVFDMKDF